jgi:hypothetical protein
MVHNHERGKGELQSGPESTPSRSKSLAYGAHSMTPNDRDDLMQEGFGAIVWPAIIAVIVLGGWGIYLIWSGWQ